mgnify:CR=1 FL=1
MSTRTQGKKRDYLVVGIGAIVALIAFFLLPYFSYSATPSSSVDPNFAMDTFNSSVGAIQIASAQGLYLLEVLLPLVTLGLAVVFMLRPRVTRSRWRAIALLGAGLLSLLTHILLAVDVYNVLESVTGYIFSDYSSVSYGSLPTTSSNYAIGYWVYLLAVLTIIVGAIVGMISTNIPPLEKQA